MAGTVFWRFHNFKVWSSEAVINTGSVGWKPRALTPSKWLRRVYLALQVFRNASLGVLICCLKKKYKKISLNWCGENLYSKFTQIPYYNAFTKLSNMQMLKYLKNNRGPAEIAKLNLTLV